MTVLIRPARIDDLQAIYEMAKLTGGGFTNLPADRDALSAKLARSASAFASTEEMPNDSIYLLVLEDRATGRIGGTAQIFSSIGTHAPFYSYRRGILSQTSRELGRTFRAETLALTTDLERASEVGGLFLHPRERAGGLGLLLARSRYLFIARHRARFGSRVIAELRGVIDEAGGSPFWDGLAGKFFSMSFQEADAFNAVNGHQFIADLMPKHPIYMAMLPDSARHVIGLPHPNGRAAMRMLESEGFTQGDYVDIFDGGPTMIAQTDAIRSIVRAREARVGELAGGGVQSLVTAGRLGTFRVSFGFVADGEDGSVSLDQDTAALLGIAVGDEVLHVPR